MRAQGLEQENLHKPSLPSPADLLSSYHRPSHHLYAGHHAAGRQAGGRGARQGHAQHPAAAAEVPECARVPGEQGGRCPLLIDLITSAGADMSNPLAAAGRIELHAAELQQNDSLWQASESTRHPCAPAGTAHSPGPPRPRLTPAPPPPCRVPN